MANVAEVSELSMSQLSIKSNGSESTTGSQSEDWDKSLNLSDSEDGHDVEVARSTTTPRNSVLFPQNEGNGIVVDSDKRSITELVKLQRGDAGEELSPDEASHVAAVLGQWSYD
ncbi:hypothetical protein DL96DRAFT_1708754 [Flagelloscypha sp. PMI_526]|nr:hypothetical protein DL96DRAFT_1708754 [Flagelloscypha sp. PMI_526]